MQEQTNNIKQQSQELKEWISRKVFAIFLGFPIFWLGFSQMYYPKYKPQDWFIWVCFGAFIISMSYFFERQTSFVAQKIQDFYTRKSEKNND